MNNDCATHRPAVNTKRLYLVKGRVIKYMVSKVLWCNTMTMVWLPGHHRPALCHPLSCVTTHPARALLACARYCTVHVPTSLPATISLSTLDCGSPRELCGSPRHHSKSTYVEDISGYVGLAVVAVGHPETLQVGPFLLLLQPSLHNCPQRPLIQAMVASLDGA